MRRAMLPRVGRHGRRAGSFFLSSRTSKERFERLTPIEHVLRRPGMYIGSMAEQREPMWLLDAAGDATFVHREARYIPGLYKLFDEILVNALDNRQRDPVGTDRIDVTIEPLTGRTTITNSGRGIPVERHAVEDVWVPEMVMGSLFTGSNFDDTEQRTVGGRHGFGAKLTNLFSKVFEVETADSAAGLKYTQRWTRNMSERGEPRLVKLNPAAAKDYTTVRYTPDLERFGLTSLPADMVGIFHRRVHEAAASAAPAKVHLNGKLLRIKGLSGLAPFYLGSGDGAGSARTVFADLSERWEVGVALSPDSAGFQAVSMVNGVVTPRGGTHVNHVGGLLLPALCPLLSKSLKLPAGEELSPARLKPHLTLFVKATVSNPEFDSQSKERLTSAAPSFGGLCPMPDAFVKKVAALPGLKATLVDAINERVNRQLARKVRALCMRHACMRKVRALCMCHACMRTHAGTRTRTHASPARWAPPPGAGRWSMYQSWRTRS